MPVARKNKRPLKVKQIRKIEKRYADKPNSVTLRKMNQKRQED